jgi:hypothetical protein
MNERIVQDERRGKGPAARNRKRPARRRHCGAGDNGGLEKMAAKRRKRRTAASRNRIRSWPQITGDADRENALEEEQTERTAFFPGFLRCLLFRNSSFAFICVTCAYIAFFSCRRLEKGVRANNTFLQNEPKLKKPELFENEALMEVLMIPTSARSNPFPLELRDGAEVYCNNWPPMGNYMA